MSDRTNGQRKMNGDGDPTRRGSLDGVHATDEQLNAMLDGALVDSERAEVERHLEECATCQTHLTELRGMTAMLRALPEPRLRRSFQLGPEHLRSNDSIWMKLSRSLLPALPALRATTVAVALLLAAVSIRNVVDDPAERGDMSIPPAMQTLAPTEQPTVASSGNVAGLQTNQQTAAPTVESAPVSQPEAAMAAGEEQENSATEPTRQGFAADTPPQEEGAPAESDQATMADESADASLAQGGAGAAQPSAKSAADGATSTFAESETGEGDGDQERSLAPEDNSGEAENQVTSADDNIAMAAAVPASPSPSPSPSATPLPPTATPTATATPTPSPTASPVPQPTATQVPVVVTASTQGGSIDGWEATQFILAVALVLLIALLVVLHRFRSDRRTNAR